jgi:hypothetical protein
VDRRLILLEINDPIRIHFSHWGDRDISQYVEILGPVEATIYLWSNPILCEEIHPQNRYRNATRACRISRILHCNRSPEVYTLVPVHRLLKKTRIRLRKLHFPSHDPHYPQQMRVERAYVPPTVSFSFTAALLDLSPASVMRFVTVLGQPGKAVLRFSWTELRNGFSRASSTNWASSAWDDTRQNPVPARLLVSPDTRYRSIHLLAVLSGTPYRLPASAVVRFPSPTRAITLSRIDWLWWGMLKEWMAL